MTKYEPWRSLLQTLGADEIVVTFEQLGEVAPLPKAAHMDPNWWSNDAIGRDNDPISSLATSGLRGSGGPPLKVVTFKKIGQQRGR